MHMYIGWLRPREAALVGVTNLNTHGLAPSVCGPMAQGGAVLVHTKRHFAPRVHGARTQPTGPTVQVDHIHGRDDM